ncbi:Uncharacterised protein [Kluyvera cryocrescens]|nr:Uncharacterised protein [Kluyvera cryocrescens]
MQTVKGNGTLNADEKATKTADIQARLNDLDRTTAAIGAMTSVTKAVQ